MGIESRDYTRQYRPAGGSFGGGDLWAIKAILIANAVVFLAQLVTQQTIVGDDGFPRRVSLVTEWLSLNLSNLFDPNDWSGSFQIWRLLTYGFCHTTRSLTHILFNMYVLWMFGRAVEPLYGSREFLAFYLTAIVASGLCHVGMQAVQHTPAGVIGASGGVMAVVFLTAMHYPRMKVLVMFVLPVGLRVLAVLYAVVDLMGAFNPAGSPVAHFAHLGGAAFGVAYKYYGWRISPWFDRLAGWKGPSLPKSRPKVKLYDPSDEPAPADRDRIDEILKKIHEQGESSLTDEERRILTDASRRFRNRS